VSPYWPISFHFSAKSYIIKICVDYPHRSVVTVYVDRSNRWQERHRTEF